MGTVSNGGRGTGKEGEGGQGAGEDGRWESHQPCDDRGCWRGGHSMNRLNRDVGRGAESAIRVVCVAVRVGMRDLYSPQDGDQKDADERKEDSPGIAGANSSVCVTHIRQYTNGARNHFVVRGDGACAQRASWAEIA